MIPTALAQGAQAPVPGGGPLEMVLFFGVLFAVFYFLMIRPQVKRQKEHRDLLGKLAKGDEVVAGAGMLGRIKDIGDNFVVLEIAKGVEVKFQKNSVQAVMPKGTSKTL
jgi:preprotein translocase subunit YajC